ncbi:MAG: DUF2442 domain-containing protein [Chloroflexota bacterium]
MYVELSNDTAGFFDVSPYLEFGIFTQLKKNSYLKQVKINFCGICWPNGQDFSADTIEYEMAVVPNKQPQLEKPCSVRGKYAYVPTSSEAFARQKQAKIALEE